MATKNLKNIFLSASVPLPERDPKYIESADIIAIREAVLALTTLVLPKNRLVWGGHPSITPMIYYVMERLGMDIQTSVLLYQSRFFEKFFPPDNEKFDNVVFTENTGEKASSVRLMRQRLFSENQFAAGIFIGGMEGVEEEFKLFQQVHPGALILPIASTGAAAKIIYDSLLPEITKDVRLEHDYGYTSLFKDFLMDNL